MFRKSLVATAAFFMLLATQADALAVDNLRLGRTYTASASSAVDAVLAAYDQAEDALQARVDRLENGGATVYDAWVDVIDVTHVSYVNGIWTMKITVVLCIDSSGGANDP